MSTVITPGRSRARGDARHRSRRGAGVSGAGGRSKGTGAGTLEELVLAAMDEFVRAGTTTCPVCSEHSLTPAGCGACGSRLG